MKRIFKIAGITSAGIIILLGLLLFLLSTGLFNNWISETICSTANQQLNAKLSIEKIEGNPLSHLQIKKIILEHNNGKLLELDELEITYNIWKIIAGKLEITSLELNGTSVFLQQDKKGIWNLEKLIPIAENPEPNVPSSPFSWKIELKDFSVKNFEANIIANDSTKLIPRKVKLSTSLGFEFAANLMQLNLHQLEINTQKPSLEIKDIHFQASLIDSVFSWTNFQIQLPKSTIHSKGSLPLNQLLQSEISLQANPFDFEDIKEWVSGIHGKPQLNLEIAKKENTSHLDFSIQQENQTIKMLGEMKDIDGLPSFHFLLHADSLNGEYWTHRADLKSNIKGEFELSGKGLDYKENTIHAEAKFADLRYKNYELDNFILFLDKNKDELDVTAKASTIFGKLDTKIHLKKLFETANYNADVKIANLDLSKLSGNQKLKSNLNLNLQAIGQGFTPGELQTKIQLQASKSVLFKQAITNLSANILIDKKEYQIPKINFEAPYLMAMLSGKGNYSENNQLHLELKSKNIAAPLLALGLQPIDFDGEITSDLSGPLNALDFKSDITIADAKLDSLVLQNLKASIHARFSGTDLFVESDSVSKKEASTDILLKNLYLSTKVDAAYIAFEKYYLANTDFTFEKNKENSSGSLTSSTILGNLKSKFTINNLFTIPVYKIESSLKNTDLSQITKNEKFRSNLNLEIAANGTGIQPELMNANLEIRSNESSLFDLPVDNFEANINYNKGEYQVNGFQIETPFVVASLIGNGNWKKKNQLELSIETTDIQQLNTALETENVQLTGQLNAKLKGPADSLHFLTTINVEKLKLDTINIQKIAADASIHFADTSYAGFLNILVNDTKIHDFDLQELQFKSKFNQQKASNSFSFYASDSLHGKIISEIKFHKDPSISFSNILLNLNQHIWTGGNDHNYIRFGRDSIEIHQFEVHSKESALKANGIFSFNGTEDLQVELRDINLINISGLKLLPYQISGKVNALLHLTGTANKPNINTLVTINNPEIDSLRFSKFHSEINYSNDQLHLESYLNGYATQLINAKLDLPVQFSINQKLLLPKEDNSIHAIVKIDQLDINKFNRFIPVTGVVANGLLSAQVKIDNKINDPHIIGKIDFSKGALQYKKLGINYSNIEMHSSLNNKLFQLDSIHINAGKGKLQLKGTAEMESLFDGTLKNIDLKLSGQNFRAFDSELLKAVINTNLSINGTPESPTFNGKVAILNSTLNTDIFLKEFNRVYDDSNQPLLVTARKNAENLKVQYVVKKDTTQKEPPNIYKKLKGNFDIEIPRNTWVKGKNMNFELAGSIKAIKENEQIDFFGTMNVKRGYYKIYGRRLEFEEGEITLTGGASLNPIVNFTIAYKFRDPDNQLRKLTVNVTGRIYQPEVQFFLDENSIEEKDAISYLIFNKSTNQLDTQENSSMKSSNLDIAKDFAIGQFSNVVKDALQSSLGLDVIEITGNTGWTQGSVSVGKYITNNLYLNYERTFTIDKKDKIIEPEKISMEYQFYRSLFLQATNQSTNSGFDFIIKWTWK
ncbi:translocation/assembly module TamB domain-containing protein [Labilibaculum filiforme]|nr:translocation/assembly module TamB domain-containing protein [Labilibaculum filiforme]